jgi:antirestriction protein ArdC
MNNNIALDKIAQSIINNLENGVIPWDKPFLNGTPRNYQSGKSYNGINALLLGTSDYNSSYWLTFNQARQLGGKIKAGSKGTPIIFYKLSEYAKENEKGEVKIKTIPFIQYSTVFNYEQTEGIKPKETETRINTPIEEAQNIANNMPNKPIITTGTQPCYIPTLDIVKIGQINNFKTAEGYYSTLFHELAHSTGHEKRLNRQANDKTRHFGSEDYSKEELVAEFTSAFLCGKAGIIKDTQRNQTAYIQSWLKALKNDKSQLITAGSQAQKAYNYILNIEA